jgi:hypothetical protein
MFVVYIQELDTVAAEFSNNDIIGISETHLDDTISKD